MPDDDQDGAGLRPGTSASRVTALSTGASGPVPAPGTAAPSDAGSDGKERAARGSRSAGTRPGILTGVLEATVRDPQVRTPAARLNSGFVFHSALASRAARPLLSATSRDGTSPGPDAAAAQPAATGTDPDFHAARPPPDEMAKLTQLRSSAVRVNAT